MPAESHRAFTSTEISQLGSTAMSAIGGMGLKRVKRDAPLLFTLAGHWSIAAFEVLKQSTLIKFGLYQYVKSESWTSCARP
jgi:hypothetical protein